jgi:hypothetical protein
MVLPFIRAFPFNVDNLEVEFLFPDGSNVGAGLHSVGAVYDRAFFSNRQVRAVIDRAYRRSALLGQAL